MIVDSQVHIWLPQSPERQWVRQDPHLPEPLTIEKMQGLMADGGVDAAVIVPPSWEGDRNDYALEAHRRFPNQFAVMGRFPVTEPEKRGELATWKNQPGMLGVRLTLHRANGPALMNDGTLDWFWPAAEKYDLPVMVHGPDVLDGLGAAAQRHPGLRLIIDHMAIAGRHTDDVPAIAAQIDKLIQLASIPNVFVKTSAAPANTTQPYPHRMMFDPIRRLIDAFGPKRCFWGTDFSRMKEPYRLAVSMFTEEMDLTAEEKDWVMGRALATCLGWPKLPA